jgi:2-haloacid dehalogenase
MVVEFKSFKVLTFDCYGTLIDWESGILDALRPLRSVSDRALTDETVLEKYAAIESRVQAGEYQLYKEVLGNVFCEMAGFLEVPQGSYDESTLVSSIQHWNPFPDTVDALRLLKKRFELAILSNIDDDLFAHSARKLEVPFDHVITAEQARSYKPSYNNFKMAIDRIGRDKSEILHVAQSLFHDIKPANELGFANVWVNRRGGKPGAGATYPADAIPGLEVPDLISLARLVEKQFG